MVEIIVTIAVAGVLMAIAVTGWQGWTAARAQSGLVSELKLTMRQAQQRAVTTGTSTCVLFNDAADSWRVLRGACGTTAEELDAGRAEDGLSIDAPTFGAGTGVTFTTRGTATPRGTVVVGRDGSDRRVVLQVEGLTGRVSTR